MNTEEALDLLKKEEEEAAKNAEYRRLREEATEEQGDRITVWKAIPQWRITFLKLAERKRKQALRQEKAQANAEAKAAQATKKAQAKAIREAEKQAAAAKKKEEREAEQARKREEKRRAAEEKAIAKAASDANSSMKRRRSRKTSGARKKTKVSDGTQDRMQGQENGPLQVASDRENSPRADPVDQPLADHRHSPSLPYSQPRPKARYTGPTTSPSTNISNELRDGASLIPADQCQ